MKLASFAAAGRDRLGISRDGRIFDLAAAAERTGARLPFDDMAALIAAGDKGRGALTTIAAEITEAPARFESFADGEVVFHPPVRTPSKILCLALNNSANADRILKGPKTPAAFSKPASALVGHRGAIKCRPEYGRVHPEPELALVIAKRAYDVPASEAMNYVFGYTIHNDITSPTMRGEDTFHYRAIHPKNDGSEGVEYVESWVSYPGRYKGSDTFSCMGPWLVTADEIADPHALAISCRHNGRVITADNTANLFHKAAEVISYFSRYMTFEPGDIISLGTALKAGARGGAVQNVDLNTLGGEVSVEIEGIGTLTNAVMHLT